jgi:ATP-dependent helicase/nuclease subunit A
MEAEEDRLLYVAATRPKQLLIISRYPAKNSISPWEDLSFIIPSERELRWEEGRKKERKLLKEVPDFTASLSNWLNWLEFTIHPSFEKSNVTSLVKGQPSSLLPRAKEGKGPIYGTVVHRCIEELGKGLEQSDISNIVTLVSEEEGLGIDYHDEVVRTIQSIINSEIWKRAQNAKQRYHEFSFLFQKEYKQIQGVIDFLFEEEDGWVIVDYKTDTFAVEDQEAFINYYRPQVELYSKEWEETFNNKVKEKGLYFTMNNQYVVV